MDERNDALEGSEAPAHKAVRPMKVVADDDGEMWLCDDWVVRQWDLESQGCWRCGDLAFTRND